MSKEIITAYKVRKVLNGYIISDWPYERETYVARTEALAKKKMWYLFENAVEKAPYWWHRKGFVGCKNKYPSKPMEVKALKLGVSEEGYVVSDWPFEYTRYVTRDLGDIKVKFESMFDSYLSFDDEEPVWVRQTNHLDIHIVESDLVLEGDVKLLNVHINDGQIVFKGKRGHALTGFQAYRLSKQFLGEPGRRIDIRSNVEQHLRLMNDYDSVHIHIVDRNATVTLMGDVEEYHVGTPNLVGRWMDCD